MLPYGSAMTYQSSRNAVVNDYLAALDESLVPLFQDIRACVLESGPQLNESIKWKDCLVYSTTGNHIQTVVGKGKISLIFLNGVELKDEHGCLDGEGKKARTMRITSADYNRAALTDYVQQTLAR